MCSNMSGPDRVCVAVTRASSFQLHTGMAGRCRRMPSIHHEEFWPNRCPFCATVTQAVHPTEGAGQALMSSITEQVKHKVCVGESNQRAGGDVQSTHLSGGDTPEASSSAINAASSAPSLGW